MVAERRSASRRPEPIVNLPCNSVPVAPPWPRGSGPASSKAIAKRDFSAPYGYGCTTWDYLRGRHGGRPRARAVSGATP
eukprot:12736643-Alexandrium_andersonii.AAC.1